MTGQRAQKEWAVKASAGRVEREAAVKCTQGDVCSINHTPVPLLDLIAIQLSNRAFTLV